MSMSTALAGHAQRAAFALDRRIRESDRALWLASAGPLFVLYLLTLHLRASDMSIDTVSVTSSAWQVAHHGTPRLPTGDGYYDAWMIPSGAGHVVSNREPGLIFLAAAFYRIVPSASVYNVSPASLAAAIVTAAAMGTLGLVLRRVTSPRVAWIAALVAGTGTSTWAVSGTALWPHGPDQLYLAAAMLSLAMGRSFGAGVAFALAAITRPPLALVAAVMGIWASAKRRSAGPMMVIGVASACGLAGFLAYSHAFWGGGLQSQYTAAGNGDFQGQFLALGPSAIGHFALNIVGTLISPGRGVFVGSPFLLVLLPGLRAAWRAAPDWARSSAVGGLLYMTVQLKANRFSGGDYFWGYRYPIELLTLAAPLLVLSWHVYASRTTRRRAWFWSLVVAAVALQLLGALCFRNPTHFSDWTPYDLATAVRRAPAVAAVICLAAYVTIAIVCRAIAKSAPGAPLSGPGADQPRPADMAEGVA